MNIEQAVKSIKVLAHDGRLSILMLLMDREYSVTELEGCLNKCQATVSQQLARLRLEGIVENRRVGRATFYRLRCEKTRAVIEMLERQFEDAA